jgi:hypothetical protein
VVPEFQPNLYPNAVGISRWPFKAQSNSRACERIVEKAGLFAVLGHNEIRPPVAIKIRGGCPALFPVHPNSRSTGRERRQTAPAIAQKEKSGTGICPFMSRTHGEKILTEKQILVSIAIEIRRNDGHHRRILCCRRQGTDKKMVSTIEKHH